VGSGLGLAIARQLVQTHRGRIGVQSQVGQGTVFTIDLPAGTAPPGD
jgi:signal transduction histidine kinase